MAKFYRKKRIFKKRIYKRKVVKRQSIKKIVKAEIARAVEDKSVQVVRPQVSIFCSTSSNFNTNMFALTPYSGYASIPQGTSQGQRIGNKITIKSLMFNYIISPMPYNSTSNPVPRPIDVIVWVFYDRESPASIPVIGSDFIQTGGSSASLNNRLTDITATVNNDRYRLLTRRVHKVGFATYAGTGTDPVYQSYTNNDYKLNAMGKINIMPYIIKKVTFNDNSTDPTTRGVFCLFQAVSATVGSLTPDYIPATVSYTIDIKYEDA